MTETCENATAETPLFFTSGGRQLLGIFHNVAEARSGEAFVFCHPLAEEKLWSHRVFVSFARRLALAGYPVLRFDYRGNGDSDGEFSECALASICDDVRASIVRTRQLAGVSTVSLLGLRSGATIASLVAEDAGAGINRLILWAPIVDGARYMQDLLRINLSTQTAIYKEIRHDREALVELMRQGQTVNVDGYEMAYTLYSDFSAIKLADTPKRFEGPCQIVQVDRQPGRADAELQQLAASYRNATLTTAQEEPFWKEIARFYDQAPHLFAGTLEWLR
jgi:exosortase A-associated hydrolase 2